MQTCNRHTGTHSVHVFVVVVLQIVGSDTQPVTAELRTAIQRAFASTTSLNKFESQVTVEPAKGAPVTTIPRNPLLGSPPPGRRLDDSCHCDCAAWLAVFAMASRL